QTWLYGHLWVTVSWIVRHPRWDVIGLPLHSCLYIRRRDLTRLPRRLGWKFATKLVLAKQLVLGILAWLRFLGRPLWSVTDGGYAKRPFLEVARQQPGLVVISRLRRDAALRSVPKVVPAGRRRPGRPRTYGPQRLSLAKRAGQRRGWHQVSCRLYGREVV